MFFGFGGIIGGFIHGGIIWSTEMMESGGQFKHGDSGTGLYKFDIELLYSKYIFVWMYFKFHVLCTLYLHMFYCVEHVVVTVLK